MATKKTKKKTSGAKRIAATGTAPKKKIRKRVKKSAPREVEGVVLSKVDRKAFNDSYTEAANAKPAKGVKPLPDPTKTSFAEQVAALVRFYRQTTPKAELGDCSTCGGDSDMRLDACPFCNDSEVSGTDGSIAPSDDEPNAEEVKATLAKHTVAELDANIRCVQTLKMKAARGIWELGDAIRFNYDRHLWKLRVSKKGVPVFKTFRQFAQAELGMSNMHAHRLMRVAAAFTREEMESVGVTKLNLLLQVPPEKRDPLVEAAKSGASRAQLSEAVQKMKDDDKPKRPRGALTCAMAPGLSSMPLMKRPPTNQPKVRKPAKTLADDPFAVEALANDVVVRYQITRNPKGELVLSIERRRANEGEVFK
jgi:hypothetical protein